MQGAANPREISVRSVLLLPLAFAAAVVAITPAPPAAAQPLASCRALLLRFVDQGCGPQVQCPQPDLVAADDACRQAVEAEPTNGEARLFRAYTRLMRLGEEDHVGPDFRTSLQGVLDRFAFSTDGNPEQYGLTADGRSLVDFTATLPQTTDPSTFGRGDGSISDRDPFHATHLEPGDYVLAIAPRHTRVDEVVLGTAMYSATYTVIGDEIDGYERALSGHGDYRIEVTGDVDVSTFEGSLVSDTEIYSVAVDQFNWSTTTARSASSTSSRAGTAPKALRSISPTTPPPQATSSTAWRTPGSPRSRRRSPTSRRSPTRRSRSRSRRTRRP